MLKGLTWLLALQLAGNLLSALWLPMRPGIAAPCSLEHRRQASSGETRVAEPTGT
jgi:hypothetical protein